jgi:hypothetical protein
MQTSEKLGINPNTIDLLLQNWQSFAKSFTPDSYLYSSVDKRKARKAGSRAMTKAT